MLRSSPSLAFEVDHRFTLPVEEDWAVMEAFQRRMTKQEQLEGNKFTPSSSSCSSGAMRAKLVNWLVEVGLHYRLNPLTLHLAVAYLDAFLAKINLGKEELQLLGVACLLIAAKLEEIYPPNLPDLAELCEGQCPPSAIAAMELRILTTLDWQLTPATPLLWLHCYLGRLEAHLPPALLTALGDACHELLHLVLHAPLACVPSLLAAGCLALRLNDLPLVTLITGYQHSNLEPIMLWLWTWLQQIPMGLPYEAICKGERPTPDFGLLLGHILHHLAEAGDL